MQAHRPGTRPWRRLLVGFLAVSLFVGACSYEVPLEPVSSVARTSFVYDVEGNVIAKLHHEEDREPVTLDEIADVLENAVIAIEDERFWAHNGVDIQATVRALMRNIEGGEVIEGGSTITQQYVKNVLIGRERTVGRKVKEASLAYQMERKYSKEAILEKYLNTVYFGNGAYGAQAAAKRWFSKTARQLTLSEAALLAGMIRAPERYDALRSPEAAEARRQTVLRRMERLGMITTEEMEEAFEEPPEIEEPDERYPAGHYVREVIEFVLDNEEFGETRQERRDLLFKGGLKIHTNIDMRMQRAAEEAVGEVLSEPGDPIAAMVAIDPHTGAVRAVWGGYDFFAGGDKAKFNFATRDGRQAGSAFKVYALTAALAEGIGPFQVYPAPATANLKYDGGRQTWKVSNYGGGGYGSLTLTEATVRSANTVYAKLILDVGPKIVNDLATEMGVKSKLAPHPASVLGTNDVTPLDMAAGFSTLAADGIRTDPKFVSRIVDGDGKVIYEAPKTRRRVLSQMVVRNVNQILQRVVTSGTGTAARLSDRPAAGKTGTAQQWRDAWFVGYTPDLVAAVWVGFPQGQISMTPPRTRTRVTGGSWPAQIWKLFMEEAHKGIPPSDFPDAPPFRVTRRIKVNIRCEPPAPAGGVGEGVLGRADSHDPPPPPTTTTTVAPTT
ncbi:MAG TPA: PBP1A family penicillin-binding protein, partial [Acidimicrobiia bacterium]|nr:PBP1A family penicillin-binding protein [Acidimicrobiia bacterium]